LDRQVSYSNQSDWLDHTSDPDWVMRTNNAPATDEFIYLLVREQEISAVEDRALSDVALGGPDTAQRTRMIQHIVRLATQSTDCAGGLAAAQAYWTGEGLAFDPAKMRLNPQSTLQASYQSAPQPDPCEPEAVGGYLGADNQLIRIQITGPNTLVWGFDDASFLYRVDIDPGGQTLTLQSQPVDAFHQPQANQAVEALRSAARLANREYVASATGVVQTLATAYNQDTMQIVLPTALPSQYTDPLQTPQAFLRVWQQQLTFTPGTPIELGTTGLFVTLDTVGGAPFHLGDYWLIAVRPTTPTQVYPQRYLNAPQPPDGPCIWACPLAAIEWNRGILKVDEYCLPPFDNLVELTKRRGTGCCTVIVTEDSLKQNRTLQSIIDELKNTKSTICLQPGKYSLGQPLVLGPEHSGLTIAACHAGVIIEAQSDDQRGFIHGLILLNKTKNITLRGLQFMLPSIQFVENGGKLADIPLDVLQREVEGPEILELRIGIGVRAMNCTSLTIEDCDFEFQATGVSVFEVGVFSGGDCKALSLKNNQFRHTRGQPPIVPGHVLEVRLGFLITPSVSMVGLRPNPTAANVFSVTAAVLPAVLDDTVICQNVFLGLSAAALIYAELGSLRIERNIVQECYSGFELFTLRFQRVDNPDNPLHRFYPIQADMPFGLGCSLGQGYPLPPGFNGLTMVRGSWTKPDPPIHDTTLAGGARLDSLFASVEFGMFQNLPRTVSALSLLFTTNQVSALLTGGSSGAGLVIWGDEPDQTAAVIVASNTVRSAPRDEISPVMAIFYMARGAVTGNAILNEAGRGGISLAVGPERDPPIIEIAVTGNVLRGNPMTLPARNVSSAPAWELLNQIYRP
jgi:hypothetical protein